MYPLLALSDQLQIPTYFVVISFVCCLTMYWFWKRAIKRDMNPHFALDLSMVIFGSGFLGARLLHVIWEAPTFYWEHPLEIFNLFAGGYVYLGGLAASVAATYYYCKIKNEIFLNWADLLAPVCALGYGLGRLACFARGCCYGKACSLPWAVSFTSHESMGVLLIPRHPTQLYAVLIELSITAYLLWRERRAHVPGEIFLNWIILHGWARLTLEIFRDDDRGFAPLGLSLATWIAVAMIAVATFALAKFKQSRVK